MIELILPVHLPSPNQSKHWIADHKLRKKLKQAIGYMLNSSSEAQGLHKKVEGYLTQYQAQKIAPEPFVCVSLLRVGKSLDSDNLAGAFKPVRDIIADWLIPGLAPGRADGLGFIDWQYQQIPGPQSFKITITLLNPLTCPDPIAY